MFAPVAAVSEGSIPRLVEGNKLRCPGCEALGDPFVNFRPLQRNERYARELNIVYVHRRDRGGCGHVFSPGDIWVMEAYLAGDLVPKQLLNEARELVAQLQGKREEATAA
jgi:hypothetical protein